MTRFTTAMGALLVGASTLPGCASTGVVMLSPGLYIARVQGGAGTLGHTEVLMRDLREESASFCLKTGRLAEVVQENESPHVLFQREASAEIRFRCVAAA